MRRHLETVLRQWQLAQHPEKLGNTRAADLYDAIRMRCISAWDRIRAVESRYGHFWADFQHEHALQISPVRNDLAHGREHRVTKARLDELVEQVVRPLHKALVRNPSCARYDFANGMWRVFTTGEQLREYRDESLARGGPVPMPVSFAHIRMLDGRPLIERVQLMIDPDGKLSELKIRPSRTWTGAFGFGVVKSRFPFDPEAADGAPRG